MIPILYEKKLRPFSQVGISIVILLTFVARLAAFPENIAFAAPILVLTTPVIAFDVSAALATGYRTIVFPPLFATLFLEQYFSIQ